MLSQKHKSLDNRPTIHPSTPPFIPPPPLAFISSKLEWLSSSVPEWPGPLLHHLPSFHASFVECFVCLFVHPSIRSLQIFCSVDGRASSPIDKKSSQVGDKRFLCSWVCSFSVLVCPPLQLMVETLLSQTIPLDH